MLTSLKFYTTFANKSCDVKLINRDHFVEASFPTAFSAVIYVIWAVDVVPMLSLFCGHVICYLIYDFFCQISGATVIPKDPCPGESSGKVIISGTPERIQIAQSLLHAFISF